MLVVLGVYLDLGSVIFALESTSVFIVGMRDKPGVGSARYCFTAGAGGQPLQSRWMVVSRDEL